MSDHQRQPHSDEVESLVKHASQSRLVADRMSLVGALRRHPKTAEAAVALRQILLTDKNPDVRDAALEAVRQLEPASKDTVATVLDALRQDRSVKVRLSGLQLLDRLGKDHPEAREVVRQLQRMESSFRDPMLTGELDATIARLSGKPVFESRTKKQPASGKGCAASVLIALSLVVSLVWVVQGG